MLSGEPLPRDRSSNGEQRAVACVELDDDRFAQRSMRHVVAQHDPSRAIARFSARRVRDVDSLVIAVTGLREPAHRERRRVVAQQPVVPSRRIVGAAEREKENGADRNPRRVEQPGAPRHASYHSDPMTRDEIERKLVEIVQKEKHVATESLRADTALADAGIDSLDSLTILFAIEEHFHISIPDDQARSMRTFGDMVDVVERLI
jgi:acyl carrier protein